MILEFYSHFGHGDLFYSREFVREIYSQLQPGKAIYFHGKSPRVLLDLPFLEYSHLDDTTEHDPRKFVQQIGNRILVNTWIGRDSKYVLPGIGCTLEMFYRMYNDSGLIKLRGEPLDYLTTINYTYYNSMLEKYNTLVNRKEVKVYIANGPVQSCQAENFNFDPIIKKLSTEFLDVIFFVTQPLSGITLMNERGGDTFLDNVYNANLIFPESAFNLNELSNLSTYCDLIIGRNSGPQVFTWTKENSHDATKTNLTFSYGPAGQHFVNYSPIEIKKLWSPNITEEGVYGKIKDTLEEVIRNKK